MILDGRLTANILSISRALSAPFLVYYAMTRQPSIFIAVMGFSLSTDILDGYIARKFGQPSESGARLDTWADFAVCSTFPYCAWTLWPDAVQSNLSFVIIAITGYFVPFLAGFMKFGKLPSYHTYSAKIAAVIMPVSIFLMLIMDIVIPFRIASFFQILVALDSVLITWNLTSHQSNTKSFFHIWKSSKNYKDIPLKQHTDIINRFM
jgi:CDP-diacylglycerol--glycerol-3-phosphate 3-phosphatidyltransferase